MGRNHPHTIATIDNLDKLSKRCTNQADNDMDNTSVTTDSSCSIEDGFDELSYCSSHKSVSSRSSSKLTRNDDSQRIAASEAMSVHSGSQKQSAKVLPVEIDIEEDDDDMSILTKESSISRSHSRCSTSSDKKAKRVSFDNSNDDSLRPSEPKKLIRLSTTATYWSNDSSGGSDSNRGKPKRKESKRRRKGSGTWLPSWTGSSQRLKGLSLMTSLKSIRDNSLVNTF